MARTVIFKAGAGVPVGAILGSARQDEFLRRLFRLGCVKQRGSDGGWADCTILAGKHRLLGTSDFFLALGHFSLPCGRMGGEDFHMGIDSGQIVTFCSPWRIPVHDRTTCLIKSFGSRLRRRRRAFCGNMRLDCNTARGDKAAHENVFRHLRHLDYWLALALVRTFSPHLSLRVDNAPASRLAMGLRVRAKRTNRKGTDV